MIQRKSRSHKKLPMLLIIVAWLFAIVQSPYSASAQAQTTEKTPSLTSDQAAYAKRTLDFIAKMDSLFFDRVEALNGGHELETLILDSESNNYDIKVARGPVVEKGGRVLTITTRPTARFQKQTSWSRFFNLDVHPKTPLVGMLHAAFVVQFYTDGTSTLGGWLDVLPAAMSQEDLDYLRQEMDKVFSKFGVDGTPHREMVCKGGTQENKRWRRRPACVGGSFYGANLMTVTEENFLLMTEAYEQFLDAYLTIVERRRDDPYTEEDLSAQDAMRLNWLEDRFYADPYTTNVTPYKAWSLYSLPPSVKF